MLTPREEEVAELIAEGHSASHIAQELGCAPRTVYAHVANIARKLPESDGGPTSRPAWRRVLVYAIRRQVHLERAPAGSE